MTFSVTLLDAVFDLLSVLLDSNLPICFCICCIPRSLLSQKQFLNPIIIIVTGLQLQSLWEIKRILRNPLLSKHFLQVNNCQFTACCIRKLLLNTVCKVLPLASLRLCRKETVCFSPLGDNTSVCEMMRFVFLVSLFADSFSLPAFHVPPAHTFEPDAQKKPEKHQKQKDHTGHFITHSVGP